MRLILSVLLSCFALSGAATHITQGQITYTCLGRPSPGKVRYKITAELYRDCNASSVPFDPFIKLAIFDLDASGKTSVPMVFNLTEEFDVSPAYSFGLSLCIHGAWYEKTVDLEENNNGYLLYHSRCCVEQQENMTDDNKGLVLFNLIPDSHYANTSPVNNDKRSVHLLVDKEMKVDFSSTDADGDSLSYSFANPYTGNPFEDDTVALPDSFISAHYRTGYSVDFPFGITDRAEMNAVTGIATLKAVKTGRYALSVEVTEWRNGLMLSKVRRDINIYVLNGAIKSAISLSAYCMDNAKISLYWIDTLRNIQNFTIERMPKGGTWSILHTSDSTDFFYYDKSATAGAWYYYRLTAHLDGGQTVVSNIDSAIIGNATGIRMVNAVSFSIYPNPATKGISIIADKAPKTIEITDLTGKVISTYADTEIDVSALKPGVYFVRCYFENSVAVSRFVKE